MLLGGGLLINSFFIDATGATAGATAGGLALGIVVVVVVVFVSGSIVISGKSCMFSGLTSLIYTKVRSSKFLKCKKSSTYPQRARWQSISNDV